MFLARPQRFGKTLLLSTVEALFQGRRDLFADTWIGQEDRWDWEGSHRSRAAPGSGGLCGVHDRKSLQTKLMQCVRTQARRHRLAPLPVVTDASPAAWLEEPVYGLWEAAGRKVVVLVDEYDTPSQRAWPAPKRCRIFWMPGAPSTGP